MAKLLILISILSVLSSCNQEKDSHQKTSEKVEKNSNQNYDLVEFFDFNETFLIKKNKEIKTIEYQIQHDLELKSSVYKNYSQDSIPIPIYKFPYYLESAKGEFIIDTQKGLRGKKLVISDGKEIIKEVSESDFPLTIKSESDKLYFSVIYPQSFDQYYKLVIKDLRKVSEYIVSRKISIQQVLYGVQKVELVDAFETFQSQQEYRLIENFSLEDKIIKLLNSKTQNLSSNSLIKNTVYLYHSSKLDLLKITKQTKLLTLSPIDSMKKIKLSEGSIAFDLQVSAREIFPTHYFESKRVYLPYDNYCDLTVGKIRYDSQSVRIDNNILLYLNNEQIFDDEIEKKQLSFVKDHTISFLPKSSLVQSFPVDVMYDHPILCSHSSSLSANAPQKFEDVFSTFKLTVHLTEYSPY